ncbi:hypothetical protein M426DRAFT_269167 [Hypoxylon sp. CI-4A]|nr:hypothetical protein M426DRAFT_269167 [Hypoxylon sp. CI-4A]
MSSFAPSFTLPLNGSNSPKPSSSTSSASKSSGWDHDGLSNGMPESSQFTAPIAICGMGLRLPGGVRDATSYWDVLVNGKDARTPIPASRYNIAGFDDSLDGRDAIKTCYGYFLDEDLANVDASMFSMTKSELEKCDPQQRQLLEVTYECLENAGEVGYRGKNIGCYIGNFGHDWMEMSLREPQHSHGYNVLGYSDMMLANRISYEYDLRGPSVVVKTACSASLVALHEACRALQAGDIVAAVVGGTSLILAPTLTSIFFAEGILSPQGSCRTFDADADGFARAEGIAAIYVKRLDDALRDGNPIRAVIRGTGSNSDGRSMGIMSPSSEAHEALIRQVYQSSKLDPCDTAFVECHGTGTVIGDPIETKAIGNVFGERGVFIGSVKPNIGHSEGCSGMASVIKGVLALEHGIIPPNIKFKTPNPKSMLIKKLAVPIKPTPIPSDRARRISINSFGIGGSNSHVSARSQPSGRIEYTRESLINSRPQLLLFSGNTLGSVKRQAEVYKSYLGQPPRCISDVGYTLAIRRERLPYRAFSVCKDGDLAESSGFVKTPTSHPAVIMVFSGQGSQWPRMGSELLSTSDTFRKDLATMETILQNLREPPTWSLMEELKKPAETSQIHRAELAQPLCTALQIALYHEFKRLGVEPSAVVGHSSGEIAGAYAAGRISLNNAIAAAYYRGYITKDAPKNEGGMAVISLSVQFVASFLRPGVRVACENSPNSTTISGDLKVLEQVLESIKADMPETFARRLKVDMAYHSHHMEPLCQTYLELLNAEEFADVPEPSPETLFLSSVTCKPLDGPYDFVARYWVDNLTSPVGFQSAVTNLLNMEEMENNVFLEIGPHSTLAGPLREISAAISRPCNYITSQTRGQNGAVDLLSAVGKLDLEGVPINLGALFPPGSKVQSELPTYPWDRSGPYWYESRLTSAWRQRRFPHHCLLGLRSVESPDFAPMWRNMLNIEHVPWIADHKIREDTVFPLAGYLSMAGEAIRQTAAIEAGYRLRKVEAQKGLILSNSKPVELITVLHPKTQDPGDSLWYHFSIASYHGSTWRVHCEGEVAPLEQMHNPSWDPKGAAESQLARKLSSPRFYEAMSRKGVVFGPEFQCLADIISSTISHVAEASIVSNKASATSSSFTLHPTVIDACIQLLIVADAKGLCRNIDQLKIPVFVESLEVSRCSTSMRARALDFTSGVECVAEDGQLHLRMSGLQLRPLETESSPIDVHHGARLQWHPDFDFMDASQLFGKPIRNKTEIMLEEQLTLLCILESADKVANIEVIQPHLAKYRNWLSLQSQRAEEGNYALVENAKHYAKMSSAERQQVTESVFARVMNLAGNHALSIGLKRICDNAGRIFKGECDALDILMQDDILTGIYDAVSFSYDDFVCMLSNSRPDMRILEVGAGTGGTTEATLRDLIQEHSLPPYSRYTFTDISAGFFPQAKERFAYAPNMEYKVFDISRDGIEQGFEASSYDIILAPNVVHATASLKATLSNLEPLLKPDGYLLLTELCSLLKSPNYIFGNFIGWWLGEADGREWEPYIQPEQWDVHLKAAGFTGVDATASDMEVPYRLSATILSQPSRRLKGCSPDRAVTVLCQSTDSEPAKRLVSYYNHIRWDVGTCELGKEMPPKGVDVVACVGLESYFFDQDMEEDGFIAFQALLRYIGDEKVLWLTHPAQMKCQNPRSAQTIGVGRTIHAELSLSFSTLEIRMSEPQFEKLVCDVFMKVRAATDGENLHVDREFIVDDGIVCIGRYEPFDLRNGLEELFLDQRPRDQKFDSQANYLLVGGTGGLGRSIATWLVEHGATDLTFLSRHVATGEEGQAMVDEIKSMGCSIHLVTGSVEDFRDVQRATTCSKKPIKGVFQLAMVLKDAPFVDMKYSDWADVIGPKVNGTWNLHEALKDHDLDFFWLSSSILTVVNQVGQGNYLAAGTFLEAFCQYRHSLGLPASVLNICPVEGVGFVAESPQAKKSMKAQGIYFLDEREFLDFLELSLVASADTNSSRSGNTPIGSNLPWGNKSQVIMGLHSDLDLKDSNNRARWRHNRRMGRYHNTHGGVKASSEERAAELSALQMFLERMSEEAAAGNVGFLATDESIELLSLEIGRKMHDFMLKASDEIDISLTLGQIGLDSLMAIELRRWLKQHLGWTTSVLEIMGSGSLRELGAMAAAKLAEKYE